MRHFCFNVPMRDGIHIVTNVFLPEEDRHADASVIGDDEKYPVVFAKNPYVLVNDQEQIQRDWNALKKFADKGFACVFQHCRGKGGSEGDFYPFVGEKEDGLDTLAWIEAQSFCDGRIYLYGMSYLSYVHLSYMSELPPSVKGAAQAVMACNVQKAFYKNGVFKSDILPLWYVAQFHPKDHTTGVWDHWHKYWEKRPATDYIHRFYGYDCQPFYDLIRSGITGEYGCPGSFSQAADAIKDLKIPILLCDGFGEMFYNGMVDMWEALPEGTKKQSAFIVGPWSHGCSVDENDKSWGYPLKHGNDMSYDPVDWFVHLRDGKPTEHVTVGKINYYHGGIDEWCCTDRFFDGQQHTTLFFQDGILTTEKTTIRNVQPVTYIYDPQNPADFPGGPNTFCTAPQGFALQPEPNFREDVKSYLTAPLTDSLTIEGRVSVHMTVSSDCEITMFLARICVVEENGNATVLQDAPIIVQNLKTNEKKMITLTTDPLYWTILPGQRLRIDISSSDKHSYWPCANLPGNWWEITETMIAHNTLWLSDSWVTIPI